jgi:hypothetical protein
LPVQLMWKAFHILLCPPPLETIPPPSDHLGPRRRPEKAHRTELRRSLSVPQGIDSVHM